MNCCGEDGAVIEPTARGDVRRVVEPTVVTDELLDTMVDRLAAAARRGRPSQDRPAVPQSVSHPPTTDRQAASTSVAGTRRRSSIASRGYRGESPAAFDRRCIPPGGVAPPSIPRYSRSSRLASRALAGLGATRNFHHGLLVPMDGCSSSVNCSRCSFSPSASA